MKRAAFNIFCCVLLMAFATSCSHTTTRKERQLVSKGNKLYTQRKFNEAAGRYEEALKENPSSASASYNLGLSQLRQVVNPADTAPASKAMLENARANESKAALRAKDRPGIASKANYNLGNLEFNTKEYQKAVEYYKQALRINPDDENARRNLRIAQKQLQNQDQNQNQNQDQNKDQNQDQNKDQDQQQNQNQDHNKDQNQDRDKDQDKQINQQTAERILQAMDNKENQTRARVNKASKGDKSTGGGRAVRKW